jgi:hypothetical protein
MDDLAKAMEAAALSEWARIRNKAPWIKDTEETRGAFVVGFARGTRFGMALELKKIAADLVGEAQGDG